MSLNYQRAIVVTGASRGLGLEWVRQLSGNSNNLVVAVVRNLEKAVALHQLNRRNMVPVQGDLSNLDSFSTLSKEISDVVGGKLDVLVNNAAIMNGANLNTTLGISKSTPAEWTEQLHVNVTSLVFFTIALLPLLNQSQEKKVINISSFFGDIEWTLGHPDMHHASYAVSKAAVALATAKFHNEFIERGFKFIALSPGWVETDMGGSLAPLKPEDSIRRCLAFVNRAQEEHSGKFFALDGQPGATLS